MSFLFDDFNGTGPPDASIWVYQVFDLWGSLGDLIQSGGDLTTVTPNNNTKGGGMWAVSAAPSADYNLVAPIQWAGSNSSGTLRLWVRAQNVGGALAGYFVELSNNTTGGTTTGIHWSVSVSNLSIFHTILGAGDIASLSAVIALSVTGSTVSFVVDGTTVFTTTDTAVSAAGRPAASLILSGNSNGPGLFLVRSITCSTGPYSAFWTDYHNSFEA